MDLTRPYFQGTGFGDFDSLKISGMMARRCIHVPHSSSEMTKEMHTFPHKRICMWSGPRNVSTALLYAFNERSDTLAVDEPLYGYYLKDSGAVHPGGADVIANMDCDGQRVVDEVVLGPCDKPVLFLKHMAHHLHGLDWGFLGQTTNVILTRHPAEVITSLINQIPDAGLKDTGYDIQVALLDHLESVGQKPIVLDAQQTLMNPPGVLKLLCDAVGIEFEPGMTSWPAGPKKCDGVWAPHWYHNVHKSSGFMPYKPKEVAVPASHQALLAECEPLYAKLRDYALEA